MEAQFTISSIVFIVWLIVPGVFFKRFYFQGQFSKQFGDGLFADRLITSIFWGVFVQIITFLLYSRSFGFTFTSIKGRLNTAYTDITKNSLPDITYQHLAYILGYVVASIFIAAILGTFFHKLIRAFKIDVKFEVFRFANQWNYYFRGDILATKDFKNVRRGKWHSTEVDLVMDDGCGGTKMLQGLLTQYTIARETGALETIYLTSAKRYSKSNSAFKEIRGDLLIVPYNRVLDLNVRFISVTNQNDRRALIYNIISVISFAGFIILLIFPWFLHLDIINIITGIVTSEIAWLLFVAILLNPVLPQGRTPLNRKALMTCIALILAFVLLSLHLFEVLVPLVKSVAFK